MTDFDGRAVDTAGMTPTAPDDILATVKTALDSDDAWRASWTGSWPQTAPPDGAYSTKTWGEVYDWLRALVARVEQAEGCDGECSCAISSRHEWHRAYCEARLKREQAEDTIRKMVAVGDAADAEVAQLKALQAATVANANMDWETATRERDEARAEVERLKDAQCWANTMEMERDAAREKVERWKREGKVAFDGAVKLQAEAMLLRQDLAALREQRCETCRYRIGSDTLPRCHMWSPTDPMAKDDPVLCRHIQFCGAWARREP